MKALYQEFFRIPKTGHIPEKNLLIRLTISILFMILCLTANGITAYAFFNHTITSGMNTIQSAGYDLEVDIIDASPAINYMAEMISEASLATTAGDTSEEVSETTSETKSKDNSKNTSENTSENLSQETLEDMLGGSLESVLEDTLAKTLQVDEITPDKMVSGKMYQITLKYPENSETTMASTGFCVVEVTLSSANAEDQKTITFHTQQIDRSKDENGNLIQNTLKFYFCADNTQVISVRLIPHWGTSSYYAQHKEDDSLIREGYSLVIEDGEAELRNQRDLQWLVDVMQEKKESEIESVSTSANQSTSDGESTLPSESVTESETATESESSTESASETESESTTEDETTTASETTSQSETTTASETTSQSETTTASETTSQSETTTTSETTSQAETTRESETTSEAETTTEDEPSEMSLEESTEESSEESVDESDESGEAA